MIPVQALQNYEDRFVCLCLSRIQGLPKNAFEWVQEAQRREHNPYFLTRQGVLVRSHPLVLELAGEVFSLFKDFMHSAINNQGQLDVRAATSLNIKLWDFSSRVTMEKMDAERGLL